MKRKLTFLMLFMTLCSMFSFGQNHWTPVTGFEDNMSLTSVIHIDGVKQENTNLELGAFYGDEVRGSAKVVHQIINLPNGITIDAGYLVYLQIQGTIGESYTFKVYNHSSQSELSLISNNTIEFNENYDYSDSNPYVINFITPVAEVNGTVYGSLTEAIEKADATHGVKLLSSVTLDAELAIAKDININLNDNAIIGTVKLNVVGATITGTAEEMNVVSGVENYVVNFDENSQTYSLVERSASGTIAYRAYIGDTDTRENIQVDLQNVYAKQSVVVKLFDKDGNLLTITSLKAGAANNPEYLTCNIVLWGSASSSWETVINAEKLTVDNYPHKAELLIDGNFTDTFENILGNATDAAVYQLPVYLALDCVYKEAQIGDTYYATLKKAFEAANANATVKVVTDLNLSETIKVNNNITLDLNGKTITGTDNATGSFALFEVQPSKEFTISDATNSGKITLTATNNRGWGGYSSVISNQRAKLTVNGGTIEHLGGTDMAYGIDNLTNGKGTYAETVINGGYIKSTYRAIRQFLNGAENAQNILTVNGGTIEGTNKSIWMQDANANANPGTLTVGANAKLYGDVYLSVAAGSTEWPVEVSIAKSALQGESTVQTNDNVPFGYELVLTDGVYGVVYKEAGAQVAYRAYVHDNDNFEGLGVDLENVLVQNSLKVELYSGEELLTTTTYAKEYPINATSFSCLIVLDGQADEYWNTTKSEGVVLTVANIPTTIKVYVDDNLVDTYETALGAGTNVDETAKYKALDCVYKLAKIGNEYYATLKDAVDAAKENDEIIILNTASDVDATINKKVILNLNENTINDAYIIVTSEVEIKNGDIKNVNESYPLVVQNGGKLIVNNVDIEASKSDRAIWVRNGSKLEFNSGSILATKGEGNNKTNNIAAIYTDTNTDVTINGGTITVDTPDNKANGIYGNYANANVTMNDGKISTSGKNYSYGIHVDGNITINGGEIVTNEKCYGYSSGIRYGNNYALVSATGNVTITDGTIITNGNSGYIVNVGRTYQSNDQTVSITGGTFTNNLSEVEMTTGGHKAPVLVWTGTASTVTATVKGGNFQGFSADLLRKDDDDENTTLQVSGGTFDKEINEEYIAPGYKLEENANGTYGVVEDPAYGMVAKIDGTYYGKLDEAFAAVQEGETIQLLPVEIAQGTVKLPATLKNVTVKGAEGAVLKDMTITAADGNSFNYEGITFDGVVFENSRISVTGWRNGDVAVKDFTVTNCHFNGLNDNTNVAPVHFNMDVDEAVKGFTFTNNVIDGATGGSKSGVYAQVTGETIFTGNTINNVSFRPYVIQLTTNDGIADTFTVTGNTFSGSAAGRAQALTNDADGTDEVELTVSNNIFKGITDAQQICYWNFNEETTTATLEKNYYDIDVLANPNKIYYNSSAQNISDLSEMGIFPIYTELNEDGTINENSLFNPVAYIETKGYEVFADAMEEAQEGDEVVLLANVESSEIITLDKAMTLNGNGYTLTSTASRAVNVETKDEVTISNLTIVGENGCERGINIINHAGTTNINNVTVSGQSHYAVNIATSAGAAKVNINNSELTGFGALVVYGEGSVSTVKESQLVGINNYSGNSDNFAAIVASVANATVAVEDGSIEAIGTEGKATSAIFTSANGTNVNVTLDTELILNEYAKYIYALDATATLKVRATYADGLNSEGYAVSAADENGLVTVEEAIAKVGKTYFADLKVAFNAAQNGDEVKILAAGTYALSTSGKNITITAAVDGVVFDNIGAKNMNGANVIFNNVTFDYYPNVNYTGLQHSGNLVYNNCIINGQVFLYGTSETFNGCTFNQNSADAYNVWTYGAADVDFNKCTFNSVGKSVLIYAEGATIFNDVTVTDCDFIASAPVDGKAAIEMDSSLTKGINLTIDGETTATGFDEGNVSGNSLWNNKKGNDTEANNDITVVVDGETVLAPLTLVAEVGGTKYTSLQAAIDAVADKGTVTLLADFEEAVSFPILEKEITINGNGKTMNGLSFGKDINTLDNGKVTITNVNFTGAGLTVKELAAVTVTNCNFTTINGDAIAVLSDNLTETITITNNVIEKTTGAGINLRTPKAVTVTDNVIRSTGGNSMTFQHGATYDAEVNIVITDNLMENWANNATEGRAIRLATGTKARTITVEGNAMVKENAPEEFVKITTGTGSQATISIDGNYWNGQSPLNENVYLVEGVFPANYYGKYTYENNVLTLSDEISLNYVALVGNVKYTNLVDAINAATSSNAVVLLSDVTLSEILVIEKGVQINADGHTLTSTADRAINISTTEEVVINDLTIATASNTERAINVVQKAANLKLQNVTAEDFKYTINVASSSEGSTITTNGGKFIGYAAVNIAGNNTKFTASNTEFVGVNNYVQNAYNNYAVIAVNNPAEGIKVNITGGKLTATTNGNRQFIVTAANVTDTEITIDAELVLADGDVFNGDAEDVTAKFRAYYADALNAQGYAVSTATEGLVTVLGAAVAAVEGTNYATLQAAIDAAQAGETVYLLKSVTGAGVVINKDVTIDFATFTYTFNEGVGSTGTETLGFQILKNNEVKLKNGTLTSVAAVEGSKEIKMLIQNYANLTLTHMNLVDATEHIQYVLSNNSGESIISGKTSITTDAVAFDVYDYSAAGYTVPTVNVNTTGIITGAIEVSETATLNIYDGSFIATIAEAWCAEGYIPTTEVIDGVTYNTVKEGKYIAQTETGAKFETLQDAVNAGTTVTLLDNVTGAGVVINKDVTIDFATFTYTFNEGVGSAGTKTIGFQILKDNNVTLKNGTLTSTAAVEGSKEIKMLIQNYANLTLTDMNLVDATDHILYVLSNNSGESYINGATSITTDAVAFDVYDYSAAAYTVPTVNVNTTGTIAGAIEVSESISTNLNISAGTFTNEIIDDWCAEFYSPVYNETDHTWTVALTGGVQERELAKGWNWFSSYVDLSDENGLETLQNALGTSGLQIKSQVPNHFSAYSEEYQEWYNNPEFTALYKERMYMIQTSAAVNLELSGDFVDYEETPIQVYKGWNWISYPVDKEVNIEEALKNLEASDNDIVKMHGTTFATYYGGKWQYQGEISTLKPGQGYMYYRNAANATQFVYNVPAENNRTDVAAVDYRWTAASAEYANNMTITAMLSVDGELVRGDYEISAIVNGEVRGSARPVYIESLDAYMLFMTVFGDDVEEITFMYYDVDTDTEYVLDNLMNYSTDAIVGSIEEPYMFNLNILGIGETSIDEISIYPNPTTTGREIDLQATCDKVEVYNALGVKVSEYTNVDSIDAIETAGIYVIRVTIDGNVRNCRLIVK